MRKLKPDVVGIVLLLLFAMINIGQTVYNDNQAIPASILGVSFYGEYKTGDSAWKPIVKGEHISASDGEVLLRGVFQKFFPDGEIAGQIMDGECVALFFDHVGASVWINGTETHVFDSENPQLGNSTCGKYWVIYRYTGTESDVLEIHLRNPHAFGNELAVDEFLDSIHIYTGEDFEFMMSKQTENLRIIGYIIIFTAVVILGIAMFAGFLHMSQSETMWVVGATILFAGIYFVVNSTEAYIWNTNIALNTTVYLLSILLYVFFIQLLIVRSFEKTFRKTGDVLVTVSGATTGILIVYATVFNSKLYDVLPVWMIFQIFISIILFIFSCRNLKYTKGQTKYIQLVFGMALICLVLDIAATWIGWWQGAFCSSFIFLIMFVATLFVVLRVFPKSIRAKLREKEMQAELEKSKTAVMFSQIQPHFLYNSLGAIRELCRQDPEDARIALSTFITYLRGNMDSIQKEHTVHFSKELNHISAYLELEKLRFGEDLNVVYDVQETDFFIPSLTIQPLVENAVKHGVCGREDGGTVILHTHREGDTIIVKIQDDGVGFEMDELEKPEHVGLNNVRNRLNYIVNGTLDIESIINVGTTVTITIHDRKD